MGRSADSDGGAARIVRAAILSVARLGWRLLSRQLRASNGRSIWWLVASIVGLSICAAPVVAQSANRDRIDGLAVELLVVALPLTAGLFALLVYGTAREGTPANRSDERPVLEVAWVVASALVLVFAGVAAYPVLATPYFTPAPAGAVGGDAAIGGDGGLAPDDTAAAADVEILAAQWEWRFRYPTANVTTRGELVLPADEEVRLLATSRDVLHAFSVPALGLKRTVYPGRETALRTNVTEPGAYRARCTEFCGTGHATMRATVTVVDQDTFQTWLATHAGRSNVTEPPEPTG
ncbi:cytochrome c oxidase subunit II [Halovivax limisalsi]|uniref:cytochrome c oxidase subunit II n=1 Tax=Halovivax limisalsi TaxID=1453760 RepID=UPI001FFC5966|nr:cytochrome c oxidase subunit II [Halovivax limisalsi]